MANTNIHTIKQGDTAPPVKGTVLQRDGVSIQDLTGATATFSMAKGSDVIIDNASASITDAPNGVVEYQWVAGDTDTASSDNRGEFRITFADGSIERVPNNKDLVIIITPKVA